jgi:hypothetical protein
MVAHLLCSHPLGQRAVRKGWWCGIVVLTSVAPDPVAGKWLVGHYLRSDPVVFLNRQFGADADGLDGERQDGTPEAFELAVRIGAGREECPAQREHRRPVTEDNVARLRGVIPDQCGDDGGCAQAAVALGGFGEAQRVLLSRCN